MYSCGQTGAAAGALLKRSISAVRRIKKWRFGSPSGGDRSNQTSLDIHVCLPSINILVDITIDIILDANSRRTDLFELGKP